MSRRTFTCAMRSVSWLLILGHALVGLLWGYELSNIGGMLIALAVMQQCPCGENEP